DYELNIPHESISSSYRLQDLTDVHIMARIQEDSGGWSPRSAAPSSGAPPTARDASAQVMAVKRLHRSQSLSPGRFTQCAKSYLSAHGRVFASPERSTNVAWGRNVPAARR
ncbi:unnamed protein product, partial [Lampetra planeri]